MFYISRTNRYPLVEPSRHSGLPQEMVSSLPRGVLGALIPLCQSDWAPSALSHLVAHDQATSSSVPPLEGPMEFPNLWPPQLSLGLSGPFTVTGQRAQTSQAYSESVG